VDDINTGDNMTSIIAVNFPGPVESPHANGNHEPQKLNHDENLRRFLIF
jgi:hypothetical protein